MSEYIGLIIASLLMTPGLLGLILPLIPGVPYMLVVALIYGLATDFSTLSSGEITWLVSLTVLSILVDYFAGIIGAKYGGAGKKSLITGFIGFIVGFLIFPPLGGFIGLFTGLLVGELLSGKARYQALRAAKGGLIGAVLGTALNIIIAITFIISFISAGLIN